MVRVRVAGPADVPGIAAVHLSSWEGAYRGVVPNEWLDNRSLGGLSEMWGSVVSGAGNNPVWVALGDDPPGDEVIGFCSLALPARDPDSGPRTGELTTLYVEPERWRAGAGGGLMDAVLAYLRDGGWGELTLWVLEDNPRARGFYEACGFKGDGSRQSAGPGGPDEIRMRRPV